MNRLRLPLKMVALAAALVAGPAFATNGYFPHGYGIRAKGMGGASVAMTGDSMGGANNPATMVWVGSRLDAGVDLFSPRRDAERSASQQRGASMLGRRDGGGHSRAQYDLGEGIHQTMLAVACAPAPRWQRGLNHLEANLAGPADSARTLYHARPSFHPNKGI